MFDNTQTGSKNLTIELSRVFFTTVIMLHHFRMYSDALPFGGGYMATDFFFMLSGLFIYSTYKHTDSVTYIKKRYIRLISEYLPLNLLLLGIYICVFRLKYPISTWEIIRENLMIEIMIPDSSARFNAPMWYLGYLLIGSFVVYISLKICDKNHRPKILIMLGMMSFILYVILILIHKNGNIYPQYHCIFDINPLVRSISGLSIGCLLGFATTRSNIKHNISLSTIPFILLIDVYLLMWLDGYTKYDILIYVFIIINVYIVNIHKTRISNSLTLKMILIAGRSSYCAYIIHFPIARIITEYRIFCNIDWKLYSLIFVIMIWLLAIFLSSILNKIISFLLVVILHRNNQ